MKDFKKFINEEFEQKKKFNGDDINLIFGFISDMTDGGYGADVTIIDKYIGDEDYWGNRIPLDDLLGYHVKLTTVGEHDHDGQMVEYKFTFTSPEGKKTILTTDMCLMVGFNSNGVTIK